MTARIRRQAARWLLTLMLIVTPPDPAPAVRSGTPSEYSAHPLADDSERRPKNGGTEHRPDSGAVNLAGWNEVQVSLRVSYVQPALLPPDEAQG